MKKSVTLKDLIDHSTASTHKDFENLRKKLAEKLGTITYAKFEGIDVGQRVRVDDFNPKTGRTGEYIEGTIVGLYNDKFKGYVVHCDYVSQEDNEYLDNDIVIPMEIVDHDYDTRIQVLDTH